MFRGFAWVVSALGTRCIDSGRALANETGTYLRYQTFILKINESPVP